jgi:nitrogen-specific signal transduction histidine kinase
MSEPHTEPTADLRVFAHDVRNMLGGISNYAQVLEMVLEQHNIDEKESTKSILELVGRINQLVALHIDSREV